MRANRLGLVSWLFALVVAVAGCQSTSRVGDRYYLNGRLPEAAAAYQVYLDSAPTDTDQITLTLYRLGVVYASPASSAHDSQRSLETLDQLLHDYPGNRYTTEAILLRDLQRRVVDLEAGVTADRARLGELESELERRQEELPRLQGQIGEMEDQIRALKESIPPLRVEISSLIHELAAKQQELEQLERLKAIDLDQPPP